MRITQPHTEHDGHKCRRRRCGRLLESSPYCFDPWRSNLDSTTMRK